MRSPFRSSRQVRFLGWLNLAVLGLISIFFLAGDGIWSQADYKLLDLYYRQAVNRGRGPVRSPRLVYVVFTDRSYEHFGSNAIDRSRLAEINHALKNYGAEAVGYDLIFARPSTTAADDAFAASINDLGCVFLPLGMDITGQPGRFAWEPGIAFERLKNEFVIHPGESGRARPFHARRALMQLDRFCEKSRGSGHITAIADGDGAFRHLALLIKVDDGYLPAMSLAMFIEAVGVPTDQIRVEWGRRIILPAAAGSLLERDVVIPIDRRGRVFVPMVDAWERDFPKIAAHDLLRYAGDENLQGNLMDVFEGNFVLVGDVASGISDLGKTTMNDNAPLVVLHASLLNALLSNRFYSQWGPAGTLALTAVVAVILFLTAALSADRILYICGCLCMLLVAGLAWQELLHFRLFPLASVGGGWPLCLQGRWWGFISPPPGSGNSSRMPFPAICREMWSTGSSANRDCFSWAGKSGS